MAISDINKMMAMYTQPTEFDQNAWKTAFDISNAFTNANNERTLADENARKLRENLATEDWRTAYQKADFLDRENLANWNVTTRDATQKGTIDFTNAQNQANTAAQNNAYMQHNAIADSWRMITDAVQANGGRMPTQEELFNIARTNPNINPALFANVASQYQNWAANQARMLAPVNPKVASQYNVLGGITPNMLDNNGNLVNFNSDQVLASNLTPEQKTNFVTGQAMLPQMTQHNRMGSNDLEAAKIRQEMQTEPLNNQIKQKANEEFQKWVSNSAYGLVPDETGQLDQNQVRQTINTGKLVYRNNPEVLALVEQLERDVLGGRNNQATPPLNLKGFSPNTNIF
ncbi:hypothetical protein [Rodentibacter pneumotropicus]|uniref:Uncharacterized protein n=1 Tax=Rodentibacter pneumotropicus TaxID=758 RepID=A0A4S2Q453_9PAST|nr:hypothetical protein [Rodentibacter pneumotropicus]THA11350.1 hypothetical protein D3M78_00610 [Rodentibacter pneumotropicus]